MESTINQKSDVSFDLNFTLTADELGKIENVVYRKAQKQVVVNGYRKGHVPIQMIRKLHGKALEEEVFDAAIQDAFKREVVDKGIRPIGRPLVTHIHRTDAGGLHGTIAYEIFPQFELKDYKGIAARKTFHNVTDAEVEAELQSARERFGTTVDAETIADEYHGVTVDLQKIMEGEPVIGDVSRDVQVYLRNETVNSELKEALLGRNVGDSVRVDLPSADVGVKSTFEVTIKKVSKVVPANLDDAFAQSALNQKEATVNDLRDAIRRGLVSEFERQSSESFRDQLVRGLLDRHPITVPQSMINEVLDQYLDEVRQGENKELPKDFDMKDFIGQMTPRAETLSRWVLLREAIVEKEGLGATEEDYEGLAAIEAERTGIDYARILRYIKKTPRYEERIRAEKALQFLEDYAIVQEVEEKQGIGLAVDDATGDDMHSEHNKA